MKATVISPLNKRLFPGTRNVPLPNPHHPNDIIDIVAEVEGEAPLNSTNTKWYETSLGYFVWSGGVKLGSGLKSLAADSYDTFIQKHGLIGDARNTGVALLDSGINGKHPRFQGLIGYNGSCLPGNSMANLTSHGNRVAGILASNDRSLKRNKSRLFSFRVTDEGDRTVSSAVETALTDISTRDSTIDIVNMSIDILPGDEKILQPLINKLALRGILVVVAAGENNYTNNTTLLNEVIRVGCFDDYKIDELKTNGLNPLYHVSFLNDPVSSYSLTGNMLDATISEDSAYCAVVSSLLARWIGSNNIPPTKNRITEAIKFLTNKCISIKKPNLNVKPFSPYL